MDNIKCKAMAKDGRAVKGYYFEYNFGGTVEQPEMLCYIVEDFKDHCQLSERLAEVDPNTVVLLSAEA